MVGLLAANLTQAAVDSQISSGLSSYVTKAYVDTQDALNATKSFIDAGDATRLKLAVRNQPNGAAGLDAGSRIDVARVALPSTQRFPSPFISPATVNTSVVSVAGTEVQVFPAVTVADPGSVYKLFVTGVLDASTNTDGEFVIVRVRQGSTTGQVVAGGYGLAEDFNVPQGLLSTDDFERVTTTSPNLGTDWSTAFVAGNPGSGTYLCDGHNVVNTVLDGNPSTFRARRINVTDAVTSTDYQELSQTFANTPTSVNAFNDYYMRVNTAFSQYVRCFVSVGYCRWYYNVGGGEAGPFNQVNTTTIAATDSLKVIAGADGVNKKFTLVRNGTVINTWNDGNSANSIAGASNRGWGIGSGNFGGGAPPASVASATIADGGTLDNYAPVNILPIPLNAQTAITGATSLYVMAVRSGAASTQSISTLTPKLFIVPFPA